MSLPLTTRYVADPTVDLESANKRYVDAAALAATFYQSFVSFTGSVPWGQANFGAADAGQFALATVESSTQFTLFENITCIHGGVHVYFNTLNGKINFRQRDDSVDVWFLEYEAAITGEIDTGVIDIDLAIGSKVNKMYDTWDGGSTTSGSAFFKTWWSNWNLTK